MRPLLPALAVLMLSSSALAGPKPPATNTFEPEIGYTYASGNTMDLRLANRAGDKAILVHRAPGSIRSFDLSDEASKRIAFTTGDFLYVKTWHSTNGVVSVGAETKQIFFGPGFAEIPDFSPDGSKVAFSVLSPTDPGIRIYDFNAPEAGSVMALAGWNVFTVRWHPDGQHILFSGKPSGTTDPKRLFRWELATGSVARISAAENFGFSFDVGRPGTPRAPLIALDIGAGLGFYALDGTDLNSGILRTLGHFDCNNEALIARNSETRKQSVIIHHFGDRNQETWSTDPNIHHTDWLRRVPCV